MPLKKLRRDVPCPRSGDMVDVCEAINSARVRLIPATRPGAWWYELITAELRKVLVGSLDPQPAPFSINALAIQSLEARFLRASEVCARWLVSAPDIGQRESQRLGFAEHPPASALRASSTEA